MRLLATLTLVVLYLACVDQYPSDDALSSDTAPLSAQFEHTPRGRAAWRATLAAPSRSPPLRERRASRAFWDYSVADGLADVAALALARALCVATVLATASAHETKDAYRARVRRALLRVRRNSVALTAKGARAPTSAAPRRAAVSAAWLCAFAAVPAVAASR